MADPASHLNRRNLAQPSTPPAAPKKSAAVRQVEDAKSPMPATEGDYRGGIQQPVTSRVTLTAEQLSTYKSTLFEAINKNDKKQLRSTLIELNKKMIDFSEWRDGRGDCTLLMHAINSKKSEAIDILMASFTADQFKRQCRLQSRSGVTALALAIGLGLEEPAKRLIAFSSKDDLALQQENNGATALHIALDVGRFEIASLLIDAMDEEDLGLQNKSEATALFLALSKKNEAIALKLIGRMKRAHLALCDINGNTALMAAIAYNCSQVAALLIKMMDQALLEYQNVNDQNALIIAISKNYVGLAYELIDKMSDQSLMAKDIYNQTPLFIALCASCDRVAVKLLNRGITCSRVSEDSLCLEAIDELGLSSKYKAYQFLYDIIVAYDGEDFKKVESLIKKDLLTLPEGWITGNYFQYLSLKDQVNAYVTLSMSYVSMGKSEQALLWAKNAKAHAGFALLHEASKNGVEVTIRRSEKTSTARDKIKEAPLPEKSKKGIDGLVVLSKSVAFLGGYFKSINEDENALEAAYKLSGSILHNVLFNQLSENEKYLVWACRSRLLTMDRYINAENAVVVLELLSRIRGLSLYQQFDESSSLVLAHNLALGAAVKYLDENGYADIPKGKNTPEKSNKKKAEMPQDKKTEKNRKETEKRKEKAKEEAKRKEEAEKRKAKEEKKESKPELKTKKEKKQKSKEKEEPDSTKNPELPESHAGKEKEKEKEKKPKTANLLPVSYSLDKPQVKAEDLEEKTPIVAEKRLSRQFSVKALKELPFYQGTETSASERVEEKKEKRLSIIRTGSSKRLPKIDESFVSTVALAHPLYENQLNALLSGEDQKLVKGFLNDCRTRMISEKKFMVTNVKDFQYEKAKWLQAEIKIKNVSYRIHFTVEDGVIKPLNFFQKTTQFTDARDVSDTYKALKEVQGKEVALIDIPLEEK